MRPDSTPVNIRLPPISDEAVVEIYDFLCDFLRLFENHYSGQIHRFYDSRSFQNLVQPDPHLQPPDLDPPF